MRLGWFFMAAALAVPSATFAQWGGFGGDQGGAGQMEYSEKFGDVNYAGDGKTYHNLDIYLPKEQKDSYPVVIHTYGSAWSMNNSKGSADLNTICAALLKAGFAVITPNHRSASDAVYPAQLHDLKAVVRFVRGNAAKYKFDTSFVAMSGFSSGGHLSSLVATTCGLEEGVSGSVSVDLVGTLGEFTSFSSCIDAACLWSPPTDIYTMNPINSFGGSGTFEGAFIGAEREGNKDKWMVASSPYYADEKDPPIILFHGDADQVVNKEQSQELYDSLKKHNVVTELVSVKGGGHGSTEMYVSANLDKMVQFYREAQAAKASRASAGDSLTLPDSMKVPESGDSLVADDEQHLEVISSAGDSTGTHETQGISAGASRVRIALEGESLRVLSEDGRFHYRVFRVNGKTPVEGFGVNGLDLGFLDRGVYCVEVTVPRGSRQYLRFVKK